MERVVAETGVSVWEEDTGTDSLYDSCCYSTEYIAPVGMDCVDGRPLKQSGTTLLATIDNQENDWSCVEYTQEKHMLAGEFWKRSAQR